jgi:tetratricopeptide (TPR) repeat protein/tRNA A-37 threonylcarbamoyl transferase component Bud32
LDVISIGERIDDKYIVVGRLGAGGFGEVFLAEDEAIPGRQLALKVLSNQLADHSDLIWEMRTLSQFNHSGIVVFHHHITHEGQLILVMEYCAGGSLSYRLNSGCVIELNEAFRWGTVLCDTLRFVHGKGIVHHDIKPANILFSTDGSIKLGDFGVANRNAGTRLYMPPEMLLGESVSKTDPRVDVYALGLTLLEMLEGEHPFESFSAEEALKARIAHDFVPETLPRWAQEILLRATHPAPELRFQNMGDFGEAIRGKHVPYVFDSNRIKADALAEKAEAHIARKKWKSAEKLAGQALHLSPDCVTALLAAGRSQLLIRRIDRAKEYFSRALGVNPRIHVQKELGWLNLEEGHLPIAISLLSDHLDRNASDFEAYNLLLKCFYLSERYEAGEDLARLMMNEKVPNDCFRNNRFLCRLLNDGYTEQDLHKDDDREIVNPFIRHNLAVARERPRSWVKGGKPSLVEKLVFQEYRFGLARAAGKENQISIRLPDGTLRETSAPIVSIGSLPTNDIIVKESSVSRRHAVLVNFPNEVWLYDLGSSYGTRVATDLVCGRMYLDGVHGVTLGDAAIEIASRADLLV